MKLLKILIITIIAFSTISYAEDLILDEDITYHNFVVSYIKDDSIVITHSTGVAKINYEKLPPQLQ